MGSNSLLIGDAQHVGFLMGGRVEETRIELRTSNSDIMLNYRFSQKLKLKLLGDCKFKYLTT